MLNKTSQKYRRFFLQKFSQELVNNSHTKETFQLQKDLVEKIKQNIEESEKRKDKEILKEIIKRKPLVSKPKPAFTDKVISFLQEINPLQRFL